MTRHAIRHVAAMLVFWLVIGPVRSVSAQQIEATNAGSGATSSFPPSTMATGATIDQDPTLIRRSLSFVAMLKSQMAEIVPDNYRPVRLSKLKQFMRDDSSDNESANALSQSIVTEADHEITILDDRWLGRFTRLQIQHPAERLPRDASEDQFDAKGRAVKFRCVLGEINVPIRGVWSSDGREVTIGRRDDGMFELVGSTSRKQSAVYISWTIQSDSELGFVKRQLILPSAPMNRLTIHLPIAKNVHGSNLTFKNDAAATGPVAKWFASTSRTKTLITRLPSNGKFAIQIDSPSPNRKQRQMVIRQNDVDYQFTPAGLLWTQKLVVEPSPQTQYFDLRVNRGRLTQVYAVSMPRETESDQPPASVSSLPDTATDIPWQIRPLDSQTQRISTSTEFADAMAIGCIGFLQWSAPIRLPLATLENLNVIRAAGEDKVRLAIDRPLELTNIDLPDDWTVRRYSSDTGVLQLSARDLQSHFQSRSSSPTVWLSSHRKITATENWLRLQAEPQYFAANSRVFFESDQPNLDPVVFDIQDGWSVESVKHVRQDEDATDESESAIAGGKLSGDALTTVADFEANSKRVFVWPSLDDWQPITSVDSPGFGVAGRGSDPATALAQTSMESPAFVPPQRVSSQRFQLAIQVDGKSSLANRENNLPATWFVRPRTRQQLARKFVTIHPLPGYQLVDQSHQLFGRAWASRWPPSCVKFLRADRDHALCIEPIGGVVEPVRFMSTDVSFDVVSQYDLRLGTVGQWFDERPDQPIDAKPSRRTDQNLEQAFRNNVDRDVSRQQMERYEIEVTSAGRALDVIKIAEELLPKTPEFSSFGDQGQTSSAQNLNDPGSANLNAQNSDGQKLNPDHFKSDNPDASDSDLVQPAAWTWYLNPKFEADANQTDSKPIQVPSSAIERVRVGTRLITTISPDEIDLRDYSIVGFRRLTIEPIRTSPEMSSVGVRKTYSARRSLPSVLGATNQICRGTLAGPLSVTSYDEGVRLVPTEAEETSAAPNLYAIRYQADAPRRVTWCSAESTQPLSIVESVHVTSVIDVRGPLSMTVEMDATLPRGLKIQFDPRRILQTVSRDGQSLPLRLTSGELNLPPHDQPSHYEITSRDRLRWPNKLSSNELPKNDKLVGLQSAATGLSSNLSMRWFGFFRRATIPTLEFDAPVLRRSDSFVAGGEAVLLGLNSDQQRVSMVAPGQSVWVVSQTWMLALMCAAAMMFLAIGMNVFSWRRAAFWSLGLTLAVWTILSPSMWVGWCAAIWLPLAAGAMLATGRRRSLTLDRTEHRIAAGARSLACDSDSESLEFAINESLIDESLINESLINESLIDQSPASTRPRQLEDTKLLPPRRPDDDQASQEASVGKSIGGDSTADLETGRGDEYEGESDIGDHDIGDDDMSWSEPVRSIMFALAILAGSMAGTGDAAEPPVQVLVPTDQQGNRAGDVVYVPRQLADEIYQATSETEYGFSPDGDRVGAADLPIDLPLWSAVYEIGENLVRCEFRVSADELGGALTPPSPDALRLPNDAVYRIGIRGNRVRSAQWIDDPNIDTEGNTEGGDKTLAMPADRIRWELDFETDSRTGDVLVFGLTQLIAASRRGTLQFTIDVTTDIANSSNESRIDLAIPAIPQSQLVVSLISSTLEIEFESLQGSIRSTLERRGRTFEIGAVDRLSAVIRKIDRLDEYRQRIERRYFAVADRAGVSITAQVQLSAQSAKASDAAFEKGENQGRAMTLMINGDRPTLMSSDWKLVDEQAYTSVRHRWRLIASRPQPKPAEFLWRSDFKTLPTDQTISADDSGQSPTVGNVEMINITSLSGDDPSALLAYHATDGVSVATQTNQPLEGLSVDQFRLGWQGELESIDRAVVVSSQLPTLEVSRTSASPLKVVAGHEVVIGKRGLRYESTFALIAGSNSPQPLTIQVPKSLDIVGVSIDGISEYPIRSRRFNRTLLHFGMRTIRPNTTISIIGFIDQSSVAISEPSKDNSPSIANESSVQFFRLHRPSVVDAFDTLDRFEILATDDWDAGVWKLGGRDDATPVVADAEKLGAKADLAKRWFRIDQNNRIEETHLRRGVVPVAFWSNRSTNASATASDPKDICAITDHVLSVAESDAASSAGTYQSVTKVRSTRSGLVIDMYCRPIGPSNLAASQVYAALVPKKWLDQIAWASFDRKVVLPGIESTHQLVRWSIPPDEPEAKMSLTVPAGDSGRIEVPDIRFVTKTPAKQFVILPPRGRAVEAVWLTEGLQPAAAGTISKLKRYREPGFRVFDAVGKRWTVGRVPREVQTGSTIVQSIDTRILPADGRYFVHTKMLIEPATQQQIEFSVSAKTRLIQTLVEQRPAQARRIETINFPGTIASDQVFALPLRLTRLPQTVDLVYEVQRFDSPNPGAVAINDRSPIEVSVGDVPVIRRWSSAMVPSDQSFDGPGAAAATIDPATVGKTNFRQANAGQATTDRTSIDPKQFADSMIRRRLSLAAAMVDAVETAMPELQIRSRDAARLWLQRRRDNYLRYRGGLGQSEQTDQDWIAMRCGVLDQRMQKSLQVFGLSLPLWPSLNPDDAAEDPKDDSSDRLLDRSTEDLDWLRADGLMRGFVIGQTVTDISELNFPDQNPKTSDGFLRWILVRLLVAGLLLAALSTIGLPAMPPRRLLMSPAVWTGCFAIAGACLFPWPVTAALLLVAIVLGHSTLKFRSPAIYRSRRLPT